MARDDIGVKHGKSDEAHGKWGGRGKGEGDSPAFGNLVSRVAALEALVADIAEFVEYDIPEVDPDVPPAA